MTMIDDDDPLYVCFTRDYRHVVDDFLTIAYGPGVVAVDDECAFNAVAAGAAYHCDDNGIPVQIVFEDDGEDT